MESDCKIYYVHFNDSNYEKILPLLRKIINSFSWSKIEIPSDYYLYYNGLLTLIEFCHPGLCHLNE